MPRHNEEPGSRDTSPLGEYWLACECGSSRSCCLPRTRATPNGSGACPIAQPYVKDGINEAVVRGATDAVNSEETGTKVAAHYARIVAPGETVTVTLRLSAQLHADPFADADEFFDARRQKLIPSTLHSPSRCISEDARQVQRQAFAGLLWSKQFYCYDVAEWLDGDPAGPPPPDQRKYGRNADWRHLNNADIISMPDTWEYPWYAAWDLAFHCIPARTGGPRVRQEPAHLARARVVHAPERAVPAYEWAFGDVNPPVHAWAAWRVYKIEKRITGKADRAFLERVFHKLLLNFTWWVNRKDSDGTQRLPGRLPGPGQHRRL